MLLKEGAPAYNTNMSGDGTIHVAARKCSTWILEMLREKGCDINKSNRDGSFPLHLAAESGNLEAVQWFLLNGAKLDARDAAAKTAADRAADARQKHVVDWFNDQKVLNKRSASTGLRALHLACIAGHARTVQELVRGGADINARSTEGLCAIHYAASGGHNEIIGILAAAKCDANAVTRDGNSALHVAVHSSNLSTVKCLIRSGVDFARGNSKGLTPLDIAAAVRKADIASHLVEVSVERALASEDSGTLVQLLQKGADLDRLIVQKSSEVSEPFSPGLRAVHYAARHGSLEMLRLLKERNVDMTSTTVGGHTALHWAALGGHLDAARWLVAHGVDAACRSKDGATALDVALKMRHTEVAEFLRRNTRVGGPGDYGGNRRQPHEVEAGAEAAAAGGGGAVKIEFSVKAATQTMKCSSKTRTKIIATKSHIAIFLLKLIMIGCLECTGKTSKDYFKYDYMKLSNKKSKRLDIDGAKEERIRKNCPGEMKKIQYGCPSRS
ncbi:putative ankyrin repeat protein RF_0381 [Penaeus indicus]|uniref:putative ankyrin repeat protein RF_0381 n=1 Tax=Penaeus indicus TaxID=29960 RepID=UPI00300C0FE9